METTEGYLFKKIATLSNGHTHWECNDSLGKNACRAEIILDSTDRVIQQIRGHNHKTNPEKVLFVKAKEEVTEQRQRRASHPNHSNKNNNKKNNNNNENNKDNRYSSEDRKQTEGHSKNDTLKCSRTSSLPRKYTSGSSSLERRENVRRRSQPKGLVSSLPVPHMNDRFFDIPPYYSVNGVGAKFLVYDNRNRNRMLIFATQESLDYLSKGMCE